MGLPALCHLLVNLLQHVGVSQLIPPLQSANQMQHGGPCDLTTKLHSSVNEGKNLVPWEQEEGDFRLLIA